MWGVHMERVRGEERGGRGGDGVQRTGPVWRGEGEERMGR